MKFSSFVFVVFLHCHLVAGLLAAESVDLQRLSRDAVRKKEYRRAIPLLQAVTNSDPNNLQARVDLAWCWYNLGDNAKAKSIASQALKTDPRSAPLSYVLSLVEAEEGSIKAALAHIETAVASNPDLATYRVHQIYLLIMDRQFDRAQRLLEQLEETDPDWPMMKVFLAEANKQEHESIEMLRAILARDKEHIGARLNFLRLLSTAPTCSKEDAKTAVEYAYALLLLSQTRPVEIAPECLLYLYTGCAELSVENYAVAESYLRIAILHYEQRSLVDREVFADALKAATEKRRFIRPHWK